MAPNIIVSCPTFPTYLLPSFNLPFRRRPSSPPPTTTATAPTPEASQIPSLSSSPTSSTTDEAPTPPNSPPPPPYQDAVTTTSSSSSSPSSPADTKLLPPSTTRPRRRTTRTAKPPALSISRTHPDTLRCSTCSSDIAFSSQIVSKGFTGRYGRAYLVSPTTLPTPASPTSTANSGPAGPGTLANVRIGKCENRQLVTGWHVVADITCLLCSAKLGWKYVDAKELSQKYKVGKFILEVERVVPFRSWEDASPDDYDCAEEGEDGASGESESDEDVVMGGSGKDKAVAGAAEREGEESGDGAGDSSESEDVEIELDSEDEDDLEDMFSGTWDPEVVAKRRSRRVTAAARKK